MKRRVILSVVTAVIFAIAFYVVQSLNSEVDYGKIVGQAITAGIAYFLGYGDGERSS